MLRQRASWQLVAFVFGCIVIIIILLAATVQAEYTGHSLVADVIGE